MQVTSVKELNAVWKLVCGLYLWCCAAASMNHRWMCVFSCVFCWELLPWHHLHPWKMKTLDNVWLQCRFWESWCASFNQNTGDETEITTLCTHNSPTSLPLWKTESIQGKLLAFYDWNGNANIWSAVTDLLRTTVYQHNCDKNELFTVICIYLRNCYYLFISIYHYFSLLCLHPELLTILSLFSYDIFIFLFSSYG